MIIIRRPVNKVRPTRGLQVLHVAVQRGRHVWHAVDQRAGGDLGGLLLSETVADLNESGGGRLSGAHRLIARLTINVRRRVSGIMQRVRGRMIPYVFQLYLLPDVLWLR